ncbi:PREDICTED: uncharacterized protein LOC109157761 [Ipomoea nil]|uniref:uncharacterized protein LOC109157761 n=1 Tax=Ipomoea nil TaxID=35883 RepID=UPI00090104C0|nr:PREDICTED: uncharacterized protein LOC109157761 [Ipomoea nil]
MTLPPGFQTNNPKMVSRLLRSLYGLKQASRQWNAKLTKALIDNGFQQSMEDPSLFTKGSSTSFVALLIFVDDILVAGPNSKLIDDLKQFLDKVFRIKDLGHLSYFLGIEALRTSDGLNLSQRKYTLEILKENGFIDSKPAQTPITARHKLTNMEGRLLEKPEIYRRLVGKLLYLTSTRPDIVYATQQLSQFVDKPRDSHLVATHRVLRYLKGSPGKGLFYSTKSHFKLKAGFFRFRLGHLCRNKEAKKQAITSISSSEAEYRALASSVCEIQWLLYLLSDLKVIYDSPSVLYCDNQSAIAIGENHVFHELTKHIEIDCHVVKQKVCEGVVKLLPISSQRQVADGFTKGLPKLSFDAFHAKLGLQDVHSPAYAGGGGGGTK